MPSQEINYWIMKSEPDAYSISDLRNEAETIWDGIRNYQARNFMRSMKIGDKAFFYHSNCKPPGIVGLMEVIETKITDPTQFEKSSKYFDPKSLKEKPRWDCAKLKYLGQFKEKLTLEEIRKEFNSDELVLVRNGNRLSIIPVEANVAYRLFNLLGDAN